MAGDWLKMEASTPEKSEVLAITARMGWDDADMTVGKLFRLWRWFDQHTLDGNAPRVTSALLDRIVGVSGFCEAVQEAGWLLISDDGISLPKFDRHNGNTAKSRALTAKRVAKHKAGNAVGNAQANATVVSGALPREEKRREDSSPSNDGENTRGVRLLSVDDLVSQGVDSQVATEFIAIRRRKKAPLTALAKDGIEKEARAAGWSLDAALRECVARGWQGFKAEWVADARPVATPQRKSFDQANAEERQRRADILTGRAPAPEASGGLVIDMEPPQVSLLPGGGV